MLVVIGCGNLARSDDGAGVEVIKRLVEHHGDKPDLKLVDAGTSGMEVMFQVRGASHTIIVDACRSNSDPGAVFHLPGNEATTANEPSFTQHGLRWDHALYAGCRMFGDDFASHTEVYLIEAQSLDFGIGLSTAVTRGVERVVNEIEKQIAASPYATSDTGVWLRNGRLHLSNRAYDHYLHGCPMVGLLARDDAWWLLPLRGGAGGLQVKLRNAKGDRVIEAQEFFRGQGLEDSDELRRLILTEDPDRGALRIEFPVA